MSPSKHIHPVDQWTRLCNALAIHKKILALLSLANIALGGLVVYLAAQPPIVIEKRGDNLKFTPGQYVEVALTSEVVTQFTRSFVKALHEVSEEDNKNDRLSHLVTASLYQKIQASGTGTKIKKISSFVTNLRVQVSEEEVTASFYKVIVVEGVPLVTSKDILLQIEQGSRTLQNPVGLYVNGIIERKT